jgi:hypothetical protein
MIDFMWCNGRDVGVARIGVWARQLGTGLAVIGALAGCGNGQSPTEAARLAESRRAEAETAKTPDVIDAMFLGNGPLIPRDGSIDCPFQGFWSGYPRGALVRVRVSTRVPSSVQAGLAAALDPIGAVTGGGLTVSIESTPEIDPQPGFNEVTVTETARPRAAGCSTDAGCIQYRFAGRGLMMGARVVGPQGRSVGAHVHDVVGHGVLGLCHIDARLIGGAENSLMSAGIGAVAGAGAPSLTGLDLEAIRTVYASGVNPGASRATFLAARLVNLQAGQLPRGQ